MPLPCTMLQTGCTVARERRTKRRRIQATMVATALMRNFEDCCSPSREDRLAACFVFTVWATGFSKVQGVYDRKYDMIYKHAMQLSNYHRADASGVEVVLNLHLLRCLNAARATKLGTCSNSAPVLLRPLVVRCLSSWIFRSGP